MDIARIYNVFEHLCGNTRFVVPAVVLMFCLFIASSYFAYKISRNGTEQSLKSDVQYRTQNIANTIEAYIRGRKASIYQLADFLLVREFLDSARQETLENNPSFPNICSLLLSVSGQDKSSTIAWLASQRDDFSLSYNDISWEKNGWATKDRPWYPNTMAAEDIYFSNPYWDFETGDICVSLVKKVFHPFHEGNSQDEVVGFAGLDIFFSPIRKSMTSFIRTDECYPILLSHDGSILYHPNKNFVFKSRLEDIDPAFAPFTEKMIHGESGTLLLSLNQSRENVYFGYTPVPGTNWSVGLIWDKDSAEKPLIVFEKTLVRSLLLNVLLFLIPLIFLQLVLSYRKRRYQKMKQLYDMIVNKMQTGIAVIDPNNDTIFLANPAYQRYLEISQKLPVPFSPLAPLLGIGITNRMFQSATPAGEIKNIELTFDGSHNYFFHYFSSFEGSGNQRLFLSVLSNVTELTKTQNSLREARDAAESASRAKSSFLANVSHEIRTPMNGIIGLVDLLAASKLDSQQHQYISLIRSSAEALLTVINDILDHSKIGAGKLLIETYEFDLHRLIQELSTSFTHSAQQKSVVFLTTVAPDVPQFVQGDANRLRQILSNFLSNAVKFTPPSGKVEFRIVILDEPEKPDWVYFAVSDTGIGFTEEQKHRLFSPFEQADNSMTRKFGGTGLGLAISKQLVELMGGSVDCRSQQGTGSIFWCELPLPASLDAEVQKENSSTKVFLKPLSVLLVDDVKVNLIVLSSMLQQWGHVTETAENGIQAIERLRTAEYDLVFMDCQMPEMDGYECTRQIRLPESAVLNHQVPIIAITAHAMAGDRERCLACGMDDYIAKPIQRRELKSLIAKWITKMGARPFL